MAESKCIESTFIKTFRLDQDKTSNTEFKNIHIPLWGRNLSPRDNTSITKALTHRVLTVLLT